MGLGETSSISFPSSPSTFPCPVVDQVKREAYSVKMLLQHGSSGEIFHQFTITGKFAIIEILTFYLSEWLFTQWLCTLDVILV